MRARIKIFKLLIICLAPLFSCELNTAPKSDAKKDDPIEDSDEISIDVGELPQYQLINVDECSELGSGSEKCQWTFAFNSEACSNKKCNKLVIYFSGGQMTCPSAEQNPNYLAHYASRGFLAVCAKLYETSSGSHFISFGEESSRSDELIKNIRENYYVKNLWNGKELLIAGVSHGASVPVIAMARHDFDSHDHWKASQKTAACFYDGIYNTQSQLSFLYDNSCGIGAILKYEDAYARYCPWTGGTFQASWPQPSTCQNSLTEFDTLDTFNVQNLSIKNWKLIECGSALSQKCNQDMVPAEPIDALCEKIDTSSEHSCHYQSYPNVTHINCGIGSESIDSCASWFDDLN